MEMEVAAFRDAFRRQWPLLDIAPRIADKPASRMHVVRRGPPRGTFVTQVGAKSANAYRNRSRCISRSRDELDESVSLSHIGRALAVFVDNKTYRERPRVGEIVIGRESSSRQARLPDSRALFPSAIPPIISIAIVRRDLSRERANWPPRGAKRNT